MGKISEYRSSFNHIKGIEDSKKRKLSLEKLLKSYRCDEEILNYAKGCSFGGDLEGVDKLVELDSDIYTEIIKIEKPYLDEKSNDRKENLKRLRERLKVIDDHWEDCPFTGASIRASRRKYSMLSGEEKDKILRHN